jgi:hypothetical protein
MKTAHEETDSAREEWATICYYCAAGLRSPKFGDKNTNPGQTMKTTDELVRELADREAIRDLPLRYCDCLSRSDIDGLVSLFIPDGVFAVRDSENEVVTRGRVKLKKMYKNLVNEVHPRPFTHTHLIELRSETSATGRCYVEMRSAKIDMEKLGSGYYEDEYIKVREEWKFVSRRLIEGGMSNSLRIFMVS